MEKCPLCIIFRSRFLFFSPPWLVPVTFTCSVLWISGWYIADVNKRVFVNRRGHLYTAFHTPTRHNKRFWFTANMGKYPELQSFIEKRSEVQYMSQTRLHHTVQVFHAWQHPDKGILTEISGGSCKQPSQSHAPSFWLLEFLKGKHGFKWRVHRSVIFRLPPKQSEKTQLRSRMRGAAHCYKTMQLQFLRMMSF